MNTRPLTIKTDRLELRAMELSDSDNMIAILTNSEVALTYMVPKFESHEQAFKMFESILHLSRSVDRFVYGIYLDKVLIGLINEVDVGDDYVELGYVIHPSYKDNGYATEAVMSAINILFDMGIQSVKAGAFENNIASMRVMEKCGMQKCDYTEEIEYNGQIHTCIIYMIKKHPND